MNTQNKSIFFVPFFSGITLFGICMLTLLHNWMSEPISEDGNYCEASKGLIKQAINTLSGFNFNVAGLSIAWLLFPVLLKSQNSPKQDFLLSPQGHSGFIISHRNNMGNLIKGHIYGAELNYVFRTNGCKTWQQIHKYPEIGVCALHMYLANPEQLGNMEALYPYTNIRLNNPNRKVSLNIRLGAGLAYLTKAFDRMDNYKNAAIGSNLNGFVNLRLNTTLMLSKAWRLDAGVGLTHASNGAVRTPNLGLNLATVNVGLGYVFGNKTCTYIKDTIAPTLKTWQPSVIAVMGIKELENPGGPKYLAYGLQGNVYRTLNYKNKLGGGIEMTYNNATKQVWANDSVYNTKFSDIVQAGIKISYSFNMNKLSVPVDFGAYVFKKQAYNGPFFHRIGLRYLITKHIIASVTLLTHWAKADYFEWGVGYQF